MKRGDGYVQRFKTRTLKALRTLTVADKKSAFISEDQRHQRSKV